VVREVRDIFLVKLGRGSFVLRELWVKSVLRDGKAGVYCGKVRTGVYRGEGGKCVNGGKGGQVCTVVLEGKVFTEGKEGKV